MSLRGLADCVVEVATLDHGLHSGLWGGVIPDALMVLARLLASLHDDDGNVAVAGLHESAAAAVDYPPERVRAESGLLDGVREIGSGSVPQRLWAKPAITVIGIDTTSIAASSNTLIPRARAKVSMRVAPGGDAAAHLDVLRAHLEHHAPWGAHVTVTLALLALLLSGGAAIHSFTATMMFGVVLVGTYTSVFIASPMLIYLGVGTGRAEAADAQEAKEAQGAKAGKATKPPERPAGGQQEPQGPQNPARPEPIRGR